MRQDIEATEALKREDSIMSRSSTAVGRDFEKSAVENIKALELTPESSSTGRDSGIGLDNSEADSDTPQATPQASSTGEAATPVLATEVAKDGGKGSTEPTATNASRNAGVDDKPKDSGQGSGSGDAKSPGEDAKSGDEKDKEDEKKEKEKEEEEEEEEKPDICVIEGISHKVLTEFEISRCPSCKKILHEKCRYGGLDHAGLRQFHITECPKCDKHIPAILLDVESAPTKAAAEAGGAEGESDEHGDGKPKPGEVGAGTQAAVAVASGAIDAATPEETDFSYVVEYWDIGRNLITKEDWIGQFDLQHERTRMKRARWQRSGGTKFQLISVLDTSIPKDSSRRPWEVRAIMDRGIVHNPDVAVQLRTTRLVIHSLPFLGAIKSVLTYDPYPPLKLEKLELAEPYSLVAHHLTELKDHKRELEESLSAVPPPDSEQRDATTSLVGDLDVVLKFVGSAVGDLVEKEAALYKLEKPSCTFRMLWLLFKPGRAVYVKGEGHGARRRMDAYMVESVSTGDVILSASPDALKPCTINLWYLNYEGAKQRVTRWRYAFEIQPFQGERTIESLNVVPCDIWDRADGGKLRQKLLDEGEQWFKLFPGRHMHYKGEFVGGRGTSYDGRVYIDPVSYYSVNQSESRPRNVLGESNLPNDRFASYDDIDPLDMEEAAKKTEPDTLLQQYLLVTKNIRGLVFKTRAWETLRVSCCEEPKVNKDPFDKLVMPEKRKMMIKSLVTKYTDHERGVWSADYIQNKGEGQIFLLHGAPGVGKTFTAECIAAYTNQPLLALTCGDLGTNEVEMEDKLNQWLKLGHKWGAVMLIDEADVFLEKRSTADLKRNSLVSVFLREVEYYRGILFLTTNRVGRFDDAFVSRIHVVIHYDNLGRKERDRIWTQFFDKLEDEKGDEIKIARSARRYVLENKEITKVKWNGREIRNAFQTAVALAEYRFAQLPANEKRPGEKAELKEEDFKQVCEMAKKFKEYLTAVNDNHDEASRAVRERLRRDDDDEEADSNDEDDDKDD